VGCKQSLPANNTWLMQVHDSPVKGPGGGVCNTSLTSTSRKTPQGGAVTGPGLPSKVLVVLEKALALCIPLSCSLRCFHSALLVNPPCPSRTDCRTKRSFALRRVRVLCRGQAESFSWLLIVPRFYKRILTKTSALPAKVLFL